MYVLQLPTGRTDHISLTSHANGGQGTLFISQSFGVS